MENKCSYPHFLSPLKIGNLVLKNRMESSNATPHFLQGPETFPADSLMDYNRKLAKNGAAIVTFMQWADPNQRASGIADSIRMPQFDPSDPSVTNYLTQLADDIHFYGAILNLFIMIEMKSGLVFSKSPAPAFPFGGGDFNGPPPGDFPDMPDMPGLNSEGKGPMALFMGGGGEQATVQDLKELIDSLVKTLKFYKDCGYDMFSFIADPYLSPLSNHREDEYGGSLENRARFPLELAKAIKKELGKDFLIEVIMPGEEDSPGGYTLADTVEFSKLIEGYIDVIQVREANGALSHATTYNSKKGVHKCLDYCKAIREGGAKVLLAPIAGFQDPEENEKVIASGVADIIAMGRAFIADPDYGKKCYEGRASDITPCIRCNKCHGVMKAPYLTFCSVNPTFGIAHKLHNMVSPPDSVKKVAVIGGGPAGLEAAYRCALRGHKVTLYEKSDKLGGQMNTARYPSFKWPIADLLDYYIRMMEKYGVEIRLNTDAKPEDIAAADYDAVIAATGAKPKRPPIEGAEKAVLAYDVYGSEPTFGKKVVIIGGSETGTETGMYLAEKGHDVTVISRQSQIAHDASRLHGITMYNEFKLDGGGMKFTSAWDQYPNLSFILNAKTTFIGSDFVEYTDKSGEKHDIAADSVIVCGGMEPKKDEALAFFGTARQFFLIGDGKEPGNLQRCVREAYAAASQI